jgi:hypothetical protein
MNSTGSRTLHRVSVAAVLASLFCLLLVGCGKEAPVGQDKGKSPGSGAATGGKPAPSFEPLMFVMGGEAEDEDMFSGSIKCDLRVSLNGVEIDKCKDCSVSFPILRGLKNGDNQLTITGKASAPIACAIFRGMGDRKKRIVRKVFPKDETKRVLSFRVD